MILKVPSYDWSDQYEYFIEEDDSLSEFDDEPDFSEYMWMENEEEFDQNVSQNYIIEKYILNLSYCSYLGNETFGRRRNHARVYGSYDRR